MNREQLHAQIRSAAIRFTDEVVGYFGETLQGLVKNMTLSMAEAKPAKAAKPAKPAKLAKPKAAPKKVAKPAAPAPKKAAKPAKPTKVAKLAKPAPMKKAAKPAKVAKAVKPAPKKPAKVAKAAKPAPKKAAKPALRSGRRSLDELDQAADRVVKLLAARGKGMRIEEINRDLGTNTRELMRPIKKLLSTKKIKKSGERRSTTYYV